MLQLLDLHRFVAGATACCAYDSPATLREWESSKRDSQCTQHVALGVHPVLQGSLSTTKPLRAIVAEHLVLASNHSLKGWARPSYKWTAMSSGMHHLFPHVHCLAISPSRSSRVGRDVQVVDVQAIGPMIVHHPSFVVDCASACPWSQVLCAIVIGIHCHLLQ